MASFHGLLAGISCIAVITSSMPVVAQSIGAVTVTGVPRSRPRWFLGGIEGATPRLAPPVGRVSWTEKVLLIAVALFTWMVMVLSLLSPSLQLSVPLLAV